MNQPARFRINDQTHARLQAHRISHAEVEHCLQRLAPNDGHTSVIPFPAMRHKANQPHWYLIIDTQRMVQLVDQTEMQQLWN